MAAAPPSTAPELSLIAINLTRRCNLACAHCYLDAGATAPGNDDELTTDEVRALLREVAGCGDGTLVVLTGGEPLIRGDVEAIASHGTRLGLAMVVGSNGTLLTERRVEALQRAGVLGVGISLDSLRADYHDAFRGTPGCWAKTLDGIENCRRRGLDFQIHFTVAAGNAHELGSMVDFARVAGARVLNVFFLVCAGAAGAAATEIAPSLYEQILHELIDAQDKTPGLVIRARCAPHFKRIAWQRDPASPSNRISGRDADGCIAATHYCRVTPEGGVTACPYIPQEVGNIRRRSFTEIWQSAPAFRRLRDPRLTGVCGRCEFRRLCGGCRARSLARGKGLMGPDPVCTHIPNEADLIQPIEDADLAAVRWSRAAERRLSRVPAFLRKLVKKRAEVYVVERGARMVRAEDLAALAARRFGKAGPRQPKP